jgi:hypothetical protein
MMPRPKSEYTEMLYVRLHPETKDKLKGYAVSNNVELSTLVRWLLERVTDAPMDAPKPDIFQGTIDVSV